MDILIIIYNIDIKDTMLLSKWISVVVLLNLYFKLLQPKRVSDIRIKNRLLQMFDLQIMKY